MYPEYRSYSRETIMNNIYLCQNKQPTKIGGVENNSPLENSIHVDDPSLFRNKMMISESNLEP